MLEHYADECSRMLPDGSWRFPDQTTTIQMIDEH